MQKVGDAASSQPAQEVRFVDVNADEVPEV